MILRASTPQDLDKLFADLRDIDKEVLERMGGIVQSRKVVDHLVTMFPSQIFVTDDGRVAALFIGLRKWEGLIEIIGYTGNAVEDNMVGFYKASLRGVQYLADVLEAHKVECIVWGDYDRSIKWLEKLGFEKEGLLRQHGPDKSNATLMGRIM